MGIETLHDAKKVQLNMSPDSQKKERMGERRGLVVSTEDCRSKGRGIESRSFSFFYSLT